MDEILKEVQSFDCEKLREELSIRGINVGPIVGSTKLLCEKSLAKRLFVERGGKLDDEDISVSTFTPVKTQTCNTPKDSDTKQNEPTLYFGISLPPEMDVDTLPEEDRDLVFTEKENALKAAKKYKGARFKVFKNENEARLFSKLTADSIVASPLKTPKTTTEVSQPAVSTESSPYKGPRVQDLLQLRKAIERGDVKLFKEHIWANPRYLVSSGDTPVIYQEGFRYTAMHVAALKNQPDICQLILDTIEDPEFVQKLYCYSRNTTETSCNRINFLVDLYLNMPDKGNCESPLHFACKFGYTKVVEVLVAHPKTDRHLKNKYGETPSDVICSRFQNAPKEIKTKIAELIQGQCYVPLIRAEDNTTQPLIGQPWSPDTPRSPLDIPKSSWSPKDPVLAVKACAGPMTPEQAAVFHKRWTTPPSDSQENNKYHATKRGDSEKGMERIGRDIAHTMEVPWLEYWGFLGAYVDLKNQHGLNRLEAYLKKRTWLTLIKNVIDQFGLESFTCQDCETPTKRDETPENSPNTGMHHFYPDVMKGGNSTDEIQGGSFKGDQLVQGGGVNGEVFQSNDLPASKKDEILSPMSMLSENFARLSVLDKSLSDKSQNEDEKVDKTNGSDNQETDSRIREESSPETKQKADLDYCDVQLEKDENHSVKLECNSQGNEVNKISEEKQSDKLLNQSKNLVNGKASQSDEHVCFAGVSVLDRSLSDESQNGDEKVEKTNGSDNKETDPRTRDESSQETEQKSYFDSCNSLLEKDKNHNVKLECNSQGNEVKKISEEKQSQGNEVNKISEEKQSDKLLNQSEKLVNGTASQSDVHVRAENVNGSNIIQSLVEVSENPAVPRRVYGRSESEDSWYSCKDRSISIEEETFSEAQDIKQVCVQFTNSANFSVFKETFSDVSKAIDNSRPSAVLCYTCTDVSDVDTNRFIYSTVVKIPSTEDVHDVAAFEDLVIPYPSQIGDLEDGSVVDLVVSPSCDAVDNSASESYQLKAVVSESNQLKAVVSESNQLRAVVSESNQLKAVVSESIELKAVVLINQTVPRITFIHGPQPTREDLDVYRALHGLCVEQDKYPQVCQWKMNVNRFSEDTNYRWQSPARLKARLRTSATSPQLGSLQEEHSFIPYGSPVGFTSPPSPLTRPASEPNFGKTFRTKLF